MSKIHMLPTVMFFQPNEEGLGRENNTNINREGEMRALGT
jgi:hypothetical protein